VGLIVDIRENPGGTNRFGDDLLARITDRPFRGMSRIVVNFAQRVYLRASGDESDVGPVVPNIEVNPVPGRDAALERAIEEIQRMHAEKEE
jgi:C-terminal processing protease CtpA/Prc